MNEICLYCHWLYLSSIILRFGKCVLAGSSSSTRLPIILYNLDEGLKKLYRFQGAANVCVGDECVQAGFCSENLCNTIENFKEMAISDFSKTP